jgi:heterodisulfide reductase subunit B
MKYGFFTGCTSQADSYENEISSRAILNHFGIDFQDIEDQNCCGTPIKTTKHSMWGFLAARIHALAKKQGYEAIATICNGCDLSLSELAHELKHHPDTIDLINEALAKEDLHYDGPLPVRNILEILYEDIGLEKIQKSVKKKLKGFITAAHYGCHAIRPKTIKRPDHHEQPTHIQEILKVLGAKSPVYPELLDCCSATTIGIDAEKALTISGEKINTLKLRGYNSIANICPFCHKQLGASQDVAGKVLGKDVKLPAMYLSQYIGLAIGMDDEALGLQFNLTGWEELVNK